MSSSDVGYFANQVHDSTQSPLYMSRGDWATTRNMIISTPRFPFMWDPADGDPNIVSPDVRLVPVICLRRHCLHKPHMHLRRFALCSERHAPPQPGEISIPRGIQRRHSIPASCNCISNHFAICRHLSLRMVIESVGPWAIGLSSLNCIFFSKP